MFLQKHIRNVVVLPEGTGTGTPAGTITGAATTQGTASNFTVTLGNGVTTGYAVLYKGGVDAGSRVATAGGTVTLTPASTGSYKARLYDSASTGICLWETSTFSVAAAASSIPMDIPNTDWRLPVLAATVDGVADTNLQANAARTLNTVTIPGTVGGATVAAFRHAASDPGALLYYIDTTNSTNFSVTVETAPDNGSNTPPASGWSVLPDSRRVALQSAGQLDFGTDTAFKPWTPKDPSQVYGASYSPQQRGQLVRLPFGGTRWTRLTFTNAVATATTVRIGLYQRSASGVDPIIAVTGNSIQELTQNPYLVWQEALATFPGIDPIFFRWSRSGAYAVDVLEECVKHGIKYNPEVRAMLMDPGGGAVAAYRPITSLDANGGTQNSGKIDLDTYFPQQLQACIDAGVRPFPMEFTFRGYTGAPTVMTGALASPITEANGILPYNLQSIHPVIRDHAQAVVRDSWDSTNGWPRIQSYSMVRAECDTWLNWPGSDDTHPTSDGAVKMRQEWRETALRRLFTGTWGNPYLVRALAVSASGVATQREKDNLIGAATSLPAGAGRDTATTGALAKANAVVVGYADPVGVYLPNAAEIGADLWLDGSNYTDPPMTKDGTNAISPLKDRITGASFVHPTTNSTRPLFIPAAYNGRGIIRSNGSTQSLSTTDAGVAGMLDAAASFAVFFITTHASTGARDIFQVRDAANANLLRFARAVGTTKMMARITTSSTNYASDTVDRGTGVINLYVFDYDHVTGKLMLYVDGTKVSETQWLGGTTKPAWTGNNVRFLIGSGVWDGDVGDLGVITGHTGALSGTIHGYLRSYATAKFGTP